MNETLKEALRWTPERSSDVLFRHCAVMDELASNWRSAPFTGAQMANIAQAVATVAAILLIQREGAERVAARVAAEELSETPR